MSDPRRDRRRRIRHIQNEAAWLQKAVFALDKAEAAREAREDLDDEEPRAYTFTFGGEDVAADGVRDGLRARADELLEQIREERARRRGG